ncbi:GSCOCG00012605001-RA-CDS [Cotesia congregata]|nr:GSCOCG00012605001-RA-CDS [Cotesia congregata]
MNKSEFHMVLPSDNSMNYFSDNTATHYTTMLPEHITLEDGKSYEFTNISKRPFSLIRGLLSSFFVYSDICSPYVTGDVTTPLLRIVPLDMSSYSYGMTVTNTYDIRDNLGNPVSFAYGPLNVTLHFKRID